MLAIWYKGVPRPRTIHAETYKLRHGKSGNEWAFYNNNRARPLLVVPQARLFMIVHPDGNRECTIPGM